MKVLDFVPLLHDNAEYVKMVFGQPSMSPYCYRPAVPWLVRMTGLGPQAGFFWVNFVSAIIAFTAFFKWLKELGYTSRFSGLCVLIWALTAHSPLAQSFLTYGVDPPATALGLLAVLAVERREWARALILVTIGPLFRETVLIAGAYALWRKGWWMPLICGVWTYVLLLAFIEPYPKFSDSYWFGLHYSWWLYLKNPLNLLAGFWVAFGPLGFLWVLCPKAGGLRDPKRFFLYAGILACLCGGVGRERFLNWFPVMIPMALLGIGFLSDFWKMVVISATVAFSLGHLWDVQYNYWYWGSAGYLWEIKGLFAVHGILWLVFGWAMHPKYKLAKAEA